MLLAMPQGCNVIPVRAGRWRSYRYAASLCPKLTGYQHASRTSGRARMGQGDVFLALDLAPAILPRHRRQLEEWKSHDGRLFFFIHDLLPLLHPEWFTNIGVSNYTAWFQSLLAYADGVICSTRSVAGEFEARLRQEAGTRSIPAHWVPLGADIEASMPSRGLPRGFERSLAALHGDAVVLMVGTIEPRKGYAQALAAFELLWRVGHPAMLVIVGNAGWKTGDLVRRLREHPEKGSRLHWFEGASDEALTALYGKVDAFLTASEAEGFGLPLVEAARFGKPILARDIPVNREIAGAHATFFNGRDPEQLARNISSWLQAVRTGSAPRTSQIRTLTWAGSAQRLLDIVLDAPYVQRVEAPIDA
jgi:glycosyltransferase involved in cell wall biosynthesis